MCGSGRVTRMGSVHAIESTVTIHFGVRNRAALHFGVWPKWSTLCYPRNYVTMAIYFRESKHYVTVRAVLYLHGKGAPLCCSAALLCARVQRNTASPLLRCHITRSRRHRIVRTNSIAISLCVVSFSMDEGWIRPTLVLFPKII